MLRNAILIILAKMVMLLLVCACFVDEEELTKRIVLGPKQGNDTVKQMCEVSE